VLKIKVKSNFFTGNDNSSGMFFIVGNMPVIKRSTPSYSFGNNMQGNYGCITVKPYYSIAGLSRKEL